MQFPAVPMLLSALAISGAMALPFSSFPNVNALMVLDDFQRPYLAVPDFVQAGLPCSIVVMLLIMTLGYSLAYWVLSA